MTNKLFSKAVPFSLLVAEAGICALAMNQTAPAVGETAPAFKLKCVSGLDRSLADFKGKIVVLEWTNPGCPVVQRHYRDGLMPATQKAAPSGVAARTRWDPVRMGHRRKRWEGWTAGSPSHV